MSNKKKYYAVLVLIWIATLIPFIFYSYIQIQENMIIDQYLSSNKLDGLPITKETAVQVSNQVRKDFNINESSFVNLNLADRPFLREDVGFLLIHKEGVCGEGTRVIINLLNRLGFDATRITLYNKKLQSAHTLVSVLIDKNEFFVDSINSLDEVNKLLVKTNISSNDFNFLHYTDNLSKRREFVESNTLDKSKEFINFFKEYWLYSYEATPYSKLLTKIGFNVKVFNFNRPNQWLSLIAEKPNLVMLFISLMTSIIIMYLLSKFRIIAIISKINKF
ncbi:MAG: hypothetical protein KAI02_02720 [Gammaproteobacteria bacterium]|nr:hypothetical protein [Gammaproteobacteria bacterium]